MDEKCVPPEMLETRRRYMDRAIEASRALQVGLITDGEFRSIVSLTTDWYEFIYWLYGVKD